MSAPLTPLAVKIKRIIQKNGGIPKCSKNLGITENTLRNYSHGSSEPTASKLHAIATLGGVTTDWLIAGKEEAVGEALAQALPVEKGSANTQLKTAHSDKAFAQKQVEICQKHLGRAQEKLDAKEDLLERAREDLLQSQQKTRDLGAQLARERDRRLVLERMRNKLLNAPVAADEEPMLLSGEKPIQGKGKEKYEEQGDERAR